MNNVKLSLWSLDTVKLIYNFAKSTVVELTYLDDVMPILDQC